MGDTAKKEEVKKMGEKTGILGLFGKKQEAPVTLAQPKAPAAEITLSPMAQQVAVGRPEGKTIAEIQASNAGYGTKESIRAALEKEGERVEATRQAGHRRAIDQMRTPGR